MMAADTHTCTIGTASKRAKQSVSVHLFLNHISISHHFHAIINNKKYKNACVRPVQALSCHGQIFALGSLGSVLLIC